jgi:hypothetical protein
MRRLLALLPLLAGCGQDSAPAQARRGHELFEPAARALAAGLLAESKARDAAEAAKLLEAAGAKDETAFLDLSTREILVRYGTVLAITEAAAVEFRAGRFDDPGNRKRVTETLEAFEKNKLPLPEVCRYAVNRVRAGEWTGLQLEFAARLLWAESMRPR